MFAAFTNESACGRIGDVQRARDKHAVGAVKKCSPTIRAVEKDVQGGGSSARRAPVDREDEALDLFVLALMRRTIKMWPQEMSNELYARCGYASPWRRYKGVL